MSASRFWFVPLMAVVACAPAIRSSAGEPVVTDRLYFGRKIADSTSVTDSAWAVFLREVVTARIPNGFTFWPAEGEWRGADGRSLREPSFVLEVVHSTQSAATDSTIVAIITEYKRRFNQESVLRVTTSGRASF
jgi:hypothetical protein